MASSRIELNVWTLPNLISVIRVALAPLLVVVVTCAVGPDGAVDQMWLWVLLAGLVTGEITDIADGAIARRTGSVSELGKLLDPFSDSFFRMLVFLAFMSVGWLPLWMMAVFFTRDILVAYLRVFSGLQGVVLSARLSGKLKAIAQGTAQIGTVVALLLEGAGAWDWVGLPSGGVDMVVWILCLIGAVVTAWSGVDYAVHVVRASTADPAA